MSDESPSVSEACLLIAEIATSLPDQTTSELRRLLGHSVAMPRNQELREMRLGLLIEMVREGELPLVDSYERERKSRKESGSDWPDGPTLIRRFGSWPTACRGAVDLAFDVTPQRARANGRRLWPGDFYTRGEVLKALRRASRKVGQEIGQWEYVELRRVERRLAAIQGRPDPRLPTLKSISICFGNWDLAIRLAMSEADLSPDWTSETTPQNGSDQ